MTSAAILRARLQEPSILTLVGAFDALTARLIEQSGFEAVYVTGAGLANSSFAVPDLGLPTMSETCWQVSQICEAVTVPVIADIDTGYGGIHNVMRTIREFERAGVGGVQIEDQVIPKRCGHFDGTRVAPVEEMVARIGAAIEARRDPDLIVIARTDARGSEGIESAVRRGRAYADAGADMVFVEAPQTRDEFVALPNAISAPLLANVVDGGKGPVLSAVELERMGFRAVLWANIVLRVAAKAVQEALSRLHEAGSSADLADHMITWEERQRLVRFAEFDAVEQLIHTEAGLESSASGTLVPVAGRDRHGAGDD